MDRSRKDYSKSTSSKHSLTPKSSLSGETDENEIIQVVKDFKSQNPKKTSRKHFLKSTVSAAAKALTPRKRILSDKNDTPFDIPLEKSLHFEDDKVASFPEKPLTIRYVMANYCSSESDGDEHHSKPYDPITNFLSPRPKYLRYNPNRRLKILDLQESKEEKKDDSRLTPLLSQISSQKVDDVLNLSEGSEDDTSLPPVSCIVVSKDDVYDVDEQDSMECNSKTGSTDTIFIPLVQGVTKPENLKQDVHDSDDGSPNQVENDRDDEEEEQFEEERGGCSFVEAFKFLLLLISIAFLTSHMLSPMNNVDLQVENLSLGNYSLNIMHQKAQIDYMNLNSGNKDVKGKGVHKYDQSQLKVDDVPWHEVKYEDDKYTWSETTEASNQFHLLEIPEIDSETFQEFTRSAENNDDYAQEKNEPLSYKRIVDQDMHIGQEGIFETKKADDLVDDVNEWSQIHQNKQVEDDQKKEEEENVDIGPIEEDLGKNTEETVSWSHENTMDETEHGESFHFNVMDNVKVESWSLETTMDETEHDESHHFNVMDNDTVESWSLETTEEENEHEETFQFNGTDNDKVMDNKNSTEFNAKLQGVIAAAYIMVPLLVLGLSFLVYIYVPQVTQGPVKNLKPVTTVPLQECNKESKSNQVPLSVDIKHLQEKIDTGLDSPKTTLFLTEEETIREKFSIKAPEVELLGELVFNEVYSNNHLRKNTKGDDIMLPSGDGSLAAAYSSIEESTTAESPSHGSFPAEKKISMKQQGSNRDRSNVKNVAATPVRRSSRIQKLAAASP